MHRRIWIPEGMYTLLPWAATAVGLVGLLHGGHVVAEAVALYVLGYGVGVLTIRASHARGEVIRARHTRRLG